PSALTLPCYISHFHNPLATHTDTLSLHDALPISSTTSSPRDRARSSTSPPCSHTSGASGPPPTRPPSTAWSDSPRRTVTSSRSTDRKSTRLNSSHVKISYAVFCLTQKSRAVYKR